MQFGLLMMPLHQPDRTFADCYDRDIMKPYQRPHPPIAVAANTPRSDSMSMAGARGFIPMSGSLLSRTYLADHWRLVEDGAASPGRQAKRTEWRIARDMLVARTPAMARERARAVLGRNYERHRRPNRVGTVQMTSTKLTPCTRRAAASARSCRSPSTPTTPGACSS